MSGAGVIREAQAVLGGYHEQRDGLEVEVFWTEKLNTIIGVTNLNFHLTLQTTRGDEHEVRRLEDAKNFIFARLAMMNAMPDDAYPREVRADDIPRPETGVEQ